MDRTCELTDEKELHDKAPREPTIKQWLDKNRRAPDCSRCGRMVEKCSPDAEACVCSACTNYLAGLKRYRSGQGQPARACPDCAGPLARRQRVCPKCRQKRRQAAFRNEKRKQRSDVLQLT